MKSLDFNIADKVVAKNTQILKESVSALSAALPAGIIQMFAGATAPTDYLICDGQSLSSVDYPDLFSAIGTSYNQGGEAAGQFRIPDFRGIFPKGAGTTTRTAGKDATGAAYAGVLAAYEQDKLQGHEHVGDIGLKNQYAGGGTYAAYNANTPTVGMVTDGAHGTPRVGNLTAPASLSINFIIKVR